MSEALLTIAALALTLGFSYIRGLRTWYAGQAEEDKKLIMLGLLLASTLGVFGASCAGLMDFVTCDQAGAMELVLAFIGAVTINQGVYNITPQMADVKAAKAARG